MNLLFIRKYFKRCKIKDLRNICKRSDLRGYSKLKKNELIQSILEKYAIIIIQRSFRKKLALNDVCPFTLERIIYPCWGKKTPKGWIYANLQELADFIVKTGDFRDPTTRMEYTSNELDQIEKLVKLCKLKTSKSIKSARSNKSYYRHQKCHEEQIDILVERIRFMAWVIREKIDDIIVGQETLETLITNMNNIYFTDLSGCTRMLSRKSHKFLKIAVNDANKIISDIPFDCTIIEKIKGHFRSWVIQENNKYDLNIEI